MVLGQLLTGAQGNLGLPEQDSQYQAQPRLVADLGLATKILIQQILKQGNATIS